MLFRKLIVKGGSWSLCVRMVMMVVNGVEDEHKQRFSHLNEHQAPLRNLLHTAH